MTQNEFYELNCLPRVKAIAEEINELADSRTDRGEAERHAAELEEMVEEYEARIDGSITRPEDYEPLTEAEQDELNEAREELEAIQAKLDSGEAFNLHEYFEDVLDIEYRINGRGEYRSVALTVCTGGPHIEVDTGDNNVKLWWGSDRAQWAITSDAAAQIDDIFEEYYNDTK